MHLRSEQLARRRSRNGDLDIVRDEMLYQLLNSFVQVDSPFLSSNKKVDGGNGNCTHIDTDAPK